MVAECMQVVPINFEKSRLSLEELARARGGGGGGGGGGRDRWRLRGACGPTTGVVNKGSFYKQTLEPFLRNVHDGVRAELFGTIAVYCLESTAQTGADPQIWALLSFVFQTLSTLDWAKGFWLPSTRRLDGVWGAGRISSP